MDVNPVDTAKTAAAATVVREMTFFETHPKAIAIGASITGFIAGMLVHLI